MSENKMTNHYNMTKGGHKPEEKGIQPGKVPNVGKPPSGGTNVKAPTNKK